MARFLNKINLFDVILSAIVIIGAAVLVVLAIKNNEPYLGSKNVNVEILVTDASAIKSVESKLNGGNELYYSGTAYTVKQVNYKLTYDEDGTPNSLVIVVTGLGDVNKGKSIFMGSRIYDNQKVELRGDYFIQGLVENYYAK